MIRITCQQDKDKVKLEELKARYDKEWQRNETLEAKATSLIQVAGTIIALIFGFVTFAQSTGSLVFTLPLQILIILAVAFAIATIIASILVLRIRQYVFIIDINKYFLNPDLILTPEVVDNMRDNVFNKSKLDEATDTSKLVKEYLIALKVFRSNSTAKADFVIASTVLLLCCVFFTTFSIVGMFWAQSSNGQTNVDEFRCDLLNADSTNIISNNTLSKSELKPDSKIMICIAPSG